MVGAIIEMLILRVSAVAVANPAAPVVAPVRAPWAREVLLDDFQNRMELFVADLAL
jgi:hypothetical protein